MQISIKGKYKGKIVSQFNVDKNLINNTVFSIEKTESYWHSHDNPHISFVLQNDNVRTKKKIHKQGNKGDVFFYYSGEMHRWVSPNSISKSINIEINKRFLKAYNFTEDDIKKSIHTNIDAKALIIKMQREVQLSNEINLASIQTLLLELVNHSKNSFSSSPPDWVKMLYTILNDNWNTFLSLNEMAKIVDVHPVTISRYFRKYFSCTLGEYQRKLKTNRSIDLIKNSEFSLSEIAYMCGFSDQSHFTRSFKQQTNFLPKDFRRL